MTKTIEFQGESITADEARAYILELTQLLESIAPDSSLTPVGQTFRQINDPRWYCEARDEGSLFCVRDNGAGWRGFILPWDGVALLIGALATQMSTRIEN